MTFMPQPQPAQHGEKTIELRIRFWTDGLGQPKGQVYPKHCCESGQVYAVKNGSHGIAASVDPVMFDDLSELPNVVAKVLSANGITLHRP